MSQLQSPPALLQTGVRLDRSVFADLRRPTLWAVAFAFGAITMMWTTYNEYVPDFLRDVFQVPAIVITLLLTMDNALAFFLEPLVGLVSDRTRTTWGKRLPWLMVAIPIGVVAFALIPLPIQALGLNRDDATLQQAFSPFALAVVGMLVAMAITRTPTVSMMPDLIAPPHRAVAHGLIQTMAGIGMLGALFSGTWLVDTFGVAGPFWASSIVMVVALAWLWVMSRSKQEEASDEGAVANGLAQWQVILAVGLWWIGYLVVVNALAPTLGLNEAQDGVFQNLWTVIFTLAALPSGFIQNTKRATQLGTLLLIGSVILLLVVPAIPVFQLLCMALGGIGWAMVTVNSLPLMLNAGPVGKHGQNTGLYYFAFAIAGLATPWLLRGVAPVLGDGTLWLAPVVWVLALVLMSFKGRG